MTRQYAEPLREVAKAIWDERVRNAKAVNGIELEPWGSSLFGGAPKHGEPTVAEANNIYGEASAAIFKLRQLGMLSQLYFDAAKAEEAKEPKE